MNTRSKVVSILCALALFVAPVAIMGCSGGCKTSAAKHTYVASGVTHVTAVAALKGWNEYLGQAYAEAAANTDTNKAAKARADLIEKEIQVDAVWQKYQASQLLLLSATQQFTKVDTNAPYNAGGWDAVTQAAIAASAAAADLVALLEKFGVKIVR